MLSTINDIEIAILVVVWFALNLSMVRDWIASRSRDTRVNR